MPLDEVLIAVALGAYTLGALALLGLFLFPRDWLRDVRRPAGDRSAAWRSSRSSSCDSR